MQQQTHINKLNQTFSEVNINDYNRTHNNSRNK